MDLCLRIVSQNPVFPLTRPNAAHHVPLSIIDATVLNFAPTETVLLYDLASSPSLEVLREALEKTLDFYPQWCGRLNRNEEQYGRLILSYGAIDDPGVCFVVGETDVPLSSFPNAEQRARQRAWDASDFPAKQLVPDNPISTSNLDDPSLHSVLIQVTRFGCGGTAVGLKFAHPLADAHTLSYFARDWASASRAIKAQCSSFPSISPLFAPHLLDGVGKSADGPHTDLELVSKAHALPSHRYDWWISGEDCPYPSESATIPDGFTPSAPGTRMPWSEWNLTAPVSHYVLHFTGPEIKRLWQAIAVSQPAASISRQDALLAHIWTCINRARGLSSDDELVHLDYTLGLRPRTEPQLPERFVGSPLVIAAVSTTGRKASASSAEAASEAASLIRATVSKFTPESVRAHIYTKLHEQSPQRLWQAFLGKRHLLVTSWIHTRMYDVDFGYGKPQYIEAVMPKIDGLLQLMEAAPIKSSVDGVKHWSDDGVDLQLHLTTEAMEKLLKDPVLRQYSVE